MNIYASLHYSYLNLAKFGTFERREVRIYPKWQEWKWHKIEVLPYPRPRSETVKQYTRRLFGRIQI